jgi:hypothetical protein
MGISGPTLRFIPCMHAVACSTIVACMLMQLVISILIISPCTPPTQTHNMQGDGIEFKRLFKQVKDQCMDIICKPRSIL